MVTLAKNVNSEKETICPYCLKEIDAVNGVGRKRRDAGSDDSLVAGVWVYSCPYCNKVLGVGGEYFLKRGIVS